MVIIVTPFRHTHQTYMREPNHLSKLTQLFFVEALYKVNIWLFNFSGFFPSQNEINEKTQKNCLRKNVTLHVN